MPIHLAAVTKARSASRQTYLKVQVYLLLG
jgi:hypothetical protein